MTKTISNSLLLTFVRRDCSHDWTRYNTGWGERDIITPTWDVIYQDYHNKPNIKIRIKDKTNVDWCRWKKFRKNVLYLETLDQKETQRENITGSRHIINARCVNVFNKNLYSIPGDDTNSSGVASERESSIKICQIQRHWLWWNLVNAAESSRILHAGHQNSDLQLHHEHFHLKTEQFITSWYFLNPGVWKGLPPTTDKK